MAIIAFTVFKRQKREIVWLTLFNDVQAVLHVLC